jgi:hypothetical protein
MQDLGKNQGQATGTLTEKQVINLLDGAGAALRQSDIIRSDFRCRVRRT